MENTPFTTLSSLLKACKEAEDHQAVDHFHGVSSGGHYLHHLSLSYLVT